MADITSLKREGKRPKNFIFRRLYIKRRSATTGLFEDNWVEITNDVKKWGKISSEIDSSRLNKFNFSSMSITLANDTGRYNQNTFDNSLWNGYATRQRTLVKIEAGFLRKIKGSDGIWKNIEVPSTSKWGKSYWRNFNWRENPIIFTGLISGDIPQSDKNDVKIQVKSLLEVFRQFSARNLNGYNNSMTASDFMQSVRDHQDVNGVYVFRPFFGDTTEYWSISSTTNEYTQLNTSTAKDVIDKNVWDIMTKLAEAENYVLIITPDGKFKFKSRASNTTTVGYEFHGIGSFNFEYGKNIKKINSFGPKYSKYYSRVQLKYKEVDTSTSYETAESTLTVSGGNTAWELGEKTFSFSNFWVPTSTVANTIVTNIFNDYSALKREIEMTTTFVPKLNILDKISVTYDSSSFDNENLWDINDWADTSGAASTGLELVWSKNEGDSIKLLNEEFNILRIEIDLDALENRIIGRET